MLKEKLDDLIQALDKNDIRKWSNRVDNKLFYNESYLPVPREKREIEEIVEEFSSVGGLQDKTHERIIDCMLSPNNKPRSVLLKREPVIHSKAGNDETLIDLILLNHSFIISLNPDSPQTKHESKGTNEIKQATSLVIGMTKTFSKNVDILLGKKTIEGCFDLKSILGITDYDADENGTTFSLIVKDKKKNILRAHFTCGSSERKNEWVNAFKMSVLQRCEMEESSLLAAALCNDISMIIQSVESNTLEIDETNNTFGCTSLHIAIINNNLDIATELLKGGANANINCKDDFPPLYYAQLTKNNDAIALLKKFGAEDTIGMNMHNKTNSNRNINVQKKISGITKKLMIQRKESEGETNTVKFHTTDETNLNLNEGNEQHKNKKLISGISKLMTGLSERGQLLGAANMKSANLKNKALNYGEMSKQLRRKTENDIDKDGWLHI